MSVTPSETWSSIALLLRLSLSSKSAVALHHAAGAQSAPPVAMRWLGNSGVNCIDARAASVSEPPSHWRREPVLAIIDARRLQAAVRLLFRRGDEDLCSGLDLAFVARDIGDDRGLRRNHDFVVAILVFHGQRLSIDAGHGLFDIG